MLLGNVCTRVYGCSKQNGIVSIMVLLENVVNHPDKLFCLKWFNFRENKNCYVLQFTQSCK